MYADGLGNVDEINLPRDKVANGANMTKDKSKVKNKVGNVNGKQPSTSTPLGNVPGMLTRSAARYLSTCLSFLLLPV